MSEDTNSNSVIPAYLIEQAIDEARAGDWHSPNRSSHWRATRINKL
jgi:hypothetical protein